MDRDRIIQSAEILAARINEEEPDQVAALQNAGFDEGEAWRLINLLPVAFSRPVLEQFGVTDISPKISAWNEKGREIVVKLNRQPEYIGALALAREHRRFGAMDHATYKTIVASSAELDALSKALNAGEDVSGSAMATVLNGSEVADFLIR